MLKINSLVINNIAMSLYDVTGQELGLTYSAHWNGNAQVLHHWAEDVKPCGPCTTSLQWSAHTNIHTHAYLHYQYTHSRLTQEGENVSLEELSVQIPLAGEQFQCNQGLWGTRQEWNAMKHLLRLIASTEADRQTDGQTDRQTACCC